MDWEKITTWVARELHNKGRSKVVTCLIAILVASVGSGYRHWKTSQ
jgi:hypothetical protein